MRGKVRASITTLDKLWRDRPKDERVSKTSHTITPSLNHSLHYIYTDVKVFHCNLGMATANKYHVRHIKLSSSTIIMPYFLVQFLAPACMGMTMKNVA